MNSKLTSAQISIHVGKLLSQVSGMISLVCLAGEHEGKMEEEFLQGYEVIV